MVRPNQSVLGGTKDEVTVDGNRLEILRLSPQLPELPTLVMLHEGLGSVAYWKDFPQKVAAQTGLGVFVYSRHGYGDSDPLQGKRSVEYMHHEAEVVLPLLLKEVCIERPLLLGHSDGGSIALIYAGRYPDSPRGLILEAPHVFVEDLSIESIARAKILYKTTDFPGKLGRYHRHVESTFWGWNDIWLDPDFRSWNIESYLDSITCPVIVIQGANDEYGTFRQVEAIQKRIPWAQIRMLPSCGHSPHRDQQDLTMNEIVQFTKALG